MKDKSRIIQKMVDYRFKYPDGFFASGVMTAFIHTIIEDANGVEQSSDIYKTDTINYVRDIVNTLGNTSTDLFFNLVRNDRDFIEGKAAYATAGGMGINVNTGTDGDNTEIGGDKFFTAILDGNLEDRTKFRLFAKSDLNQKENDALGIINTTLYQIHKAKYNENTMTSEVEFEAIDAWSVKNSDKKTINLQFGTGVEAPQAKKAKIFFNGISLMSGVFFKESTLPVDYTFLGHELNGTDFKGGLLSHLVVIPEVFSSNNVRWYTPWVDQYTYLLHATDHNNIKNKHRLTVETQYSDNTGFLDCLPTASNSTDDIEVYDAIPNTAYLVIRNINVAGSASGAIKQMNLIKDTFVDKAPAPHSIFFNPTDSVRNNVTGDGNGVSEPTWQDNQFSPYVVDCGYGKTVGGDHTFFISRPNLLDDTIRTQQDIDSNLENLGEVLKGNISFEGSTFTGLENTVETNSKRTDISNLPTDNAEMVVINKRFYDVVDLANKPDNFSLHRLEWDGGVIDAYLDFPVYTDPDNSNITFSPSYIDGSKFLESGGKEEAYIFDFGETKTINSFGWNIFTAGNMKIQFLDENDDEVLLLNMSSPSNSGLLNTSKQITLVGGTSREQEIINKHKKEIKKQEKLKQRRKQLKNKK